MTVEYDPGAGIIATAFRLKSTAVLQVIGNCEFWFLLVVHLAIAIAHKRGYYEPEQYHLELAMGLTGITGSLMTFFVVFYNGNVFARYNRLYELTKNMNECCLFAASIINRELPDISMKRKLARLLLASAFIFFFERTESEGHGNISAEEWKQLKRLGLLSADETRILQKHCEELGKESSMPSYMLLQWSMKMYRAKSSRLNELEKTYWNIRRCQDDVVEVLELPMPFQYFHIMNLMLTLNLTLWSYALALEDSYFASIIFMFVQLVFQGIRELSVALADPYGTDDADFPLDDWMTQLYFRINAIIEDEYDGKIEQQLLGNIKPLKKLKRGKHVIDLLVDQKVSPRDDRFSEENSGEEDEREPLDPSKHRHSGDDTSLPAQMKASQEQEESEEEDDDDD